MATAPVAATSVFRDDLLDSATDADVDPAPGPDEPPLECCNDALLVLLHHSLTWWKTNAKRTGLGWAFLVPEDDALIAKAEQGLSLPTNHGVICWLCHLEHHGDMHPNYPFNPDVSDACEDDDVKESPTVSEAVKYLTEEGCEKIDRSKIMAMTYKHSSSSTHLRQHAKKHHPDVFQLLLTTNGHDSNTAASGANDEGTQSTMHLPSAFRSIKRLKVDDPRQRLFDRLLTYVIVFLRWSFSVVDNPWFRCFVWFMDGSLRIPSRKEWQTRNLVEAVEDAHTKVMKSLDGVKGVSLMFDLWMSRAGKLPMLSLYLPTMTCI